MWACGCAALGRYSTGFIDEKMIQQHMPKPGPERVHCTQAHAWRSPARHPRIAHAVAAPTVDCV